MKCGCKIKYQYDPKLGDNHDTIIFCPLHTQAEAMLEALKEIKEAADLRMDLSPGSPRPIYNKIIAVIAKAEGA